MKNIILFVLSITLLVGCASQVPTTKFKMGTATLELPKDMNAKDLVIEFDGTSKFTLKATSISSANNPQVISTSGEANVAVIDAHYKGASVIIDKAIQAGIQGGSKAIVP